MSDPCRMLVLVAIAVFALQLACMSDKDEDEEDGHPDGQEKREIHPPDVHAVHREAGNLHDPAQPPLGQDVLQLRDEDEGGVDPHQHHRRVKQSLHEY